MQTIVYNPFIGVSRPFALLVDGVMQRTYSRDELIELGEEYDRAGTEALISLKAAIVDKKEE